MNQPGPFLKSEALAPQIIQALACLEQTGVRDYWVNGEFERNGTWYIFLAESAWPVRMNKNSTKRISLSSERCANGRVLCAQGEVVLADCLP